MKSPTNAATGGESLVDKGERLPGGLLSYRVVELEDSEVLVDSGFSEEKSKLSSWPFHLTCI